MRTLALVSVLLAGCAARAQPNTVVSVVKVVAPTAKCVPQRAYGSLDVALCYEGAAVMLCTGGGTTQVSCKPAFRLPEPPAPTAPVEPKATESEPSESSS